MSTTSNKKAGLFTNPTLQPSTTNRFYNPKNYDTIAMNYFVFSDANKLSVRKLVCNKSHKSLEKLIKFLESSIRPSFSSFFNSLEITSREVLSCKAKS